MFKKQSEHQLEVLKRNARAGKISRRKFMEGALALGATIPAAASFWATNVKAAASKTGGQSVHTSNVWKNHGQPRSPRGVLKAVVEHGTPTISSQLQNTTTGSIKAVGVR